MGGLASWSDAMLCYNNVCKGCRQGFSCENMILRPPAAKGLTAVAMLHEYLLPGMLF
jgi:hypothetical protein